MHKTHDIKKGDTLRFENFPIALMQDGEAEFEVTGVTFARGDRLELTIEKIHHENSN